MKTSSLVFASALALLSLPALAARRSSPRVRSVSGEVLVKLKASTRATRLQAARRLGLGAPKTLGRTRFVQAQVPSGESFEQVQARLMRDPSVEKVEPNVLFDLSAVPNDPLLGQQWGVQNTGQTLSLIGVVGPDPLEAGANPGNAGADMNLAPAWDLITDCRSVVVAVVDTGVNFDHEDLAANMWDDGSGHTGYDFGDNDSNPNDTQGHGTHVAGTIAAVGNNSKGGTGVCWQAKIMAIKVANAAGEIPTSALINGIAYARTNGAKVVNLSLGSSIYLTSLEDALDDARAAGIVVVAAAGNDGADNDDASTPTYPCNYALSNVICVAALDQRDELADFSNYGTDNVDVGAPGVNIASSWYSLESTVVPSSGEAFVNSSGGRTAWNLPASPASTAMTIGSVSLSDGRTNVGFLKTQANLSGSYANNANDIAWRVFDLSSTAAAQFVLLKASVLYKMVDSDHFDLAVANSASQDPWTAGASSLTSFTGGTGDYFEDVSYDISSACKGQATCSAGLRFTSNASGVSTGVGVIDFKIVSFTYSDVTYNYLAGTSMATPHVAGLATMLLAYNPSFTAADVITAIQEGGRPLDSLTGYTATGKAADAHGSLRYLAAPTGLAGTSP